MVVVVVVVRVVVCSYYIAQGLLIHSFAYYSKMLITEHAIED